jgi:hypothetical protein
MVYLAVEEKHLLFMYKAFVMMGVILVFDF